MAGFRPPELLLEAALLLVLFLQRLTVRNALRPLEQARQQIAQLQALSDEERAALFSSATGQTGSATQAPVTNPVVVEPRDVRPAQSSNSAILDNAVQSGQAQQRDLDEQFTPLSAGQPAQAATDQADAPGASAAERVERAPLQ